MSYPMEELDRELAWLEQEHIAGYSDGHDLDEPEPSANRSAAYRHSFRIARAEKCGNPIPAVLSRMDAAQIRSDVASAALGVRRPA